jgi:transposase-like protein
MGRPKGGTNRYWSKEAKYEYVKLVMSGEISSKELGRENNVSNSLISTWIKKFQEGGIDGLENKRKPGNPLVRYQRRKELTPLEQLEYENLKLRIENERLKKGYTTEEVMALKQRRPSKKNTKS